ncbi:MAG: zeta toxin family protein [Chthoniobacterales bacterium]
MAPIKPLLIVIAGPNGSGKTTATKILCSKYPEWTNALIEVNPDTIAQQEFGDWNNVHSIRKAAERADKIREECLQERCGLLFETVLSMPDKVDFIRRAKKAGFFIRLVYVATDSPEINTLRVAWRVEQGGHTVPEEKIYSRYERSLKLAIEVAKIVDRAYFVDNSKDFKEGHKTKQLQPLFRMVDGVVVKTYLDPENFPNWIKPIYKEALKKPSPDRA